MLIDVDFIRKTESEFQNIPLNNDILTFYYDETGNCGKFVLIEDGFNDNRALINDFILGGVMHEGTVCNADTDKLLRDLRLNPGAKELKFDKLYKHGTPFMDFIGCRRISVYLEWLAESGLYIHYSTMNNLYYAMVDMVDSLWDSQPEFAFSREWVLELKSAVFWFCKEHLEETMAVLYKYHFPNIEKEKTQQFTSDFCALIDQFSDMDDSEDRERAFMLECFRQMLKHAGKQGSLVFLHDNKDNILVDEYYGLYLGRCYTYKNATHYFDEAKEIRKRVDATQLESEGKRFRNYDFVDSKQNILIQICDVFVGLLGELFSFLDSISLVDVLFIKGDMTAAQLRNLSLISRLFDEAEEKHIMLIHNANDLFTTMSRAKKLEILIDENIPGVKRTSRDLE